jgi:hypothetical protein
MNSDICVLSVGDLIDVRPLSRFVLIKMKGRRGICVLSLGDLIDVRPLSRSVAFISNLSCNLFPVQQEMTQ